jgi:hypothetical protein
MRKRCGTRNAVHNEIDLARISEHRNRGLAHVVQRTIEFERAIDDTAKLGQVSLLLRHALLIVDIGARAKPAHDLAGLVVHRCASGKKPASTSVSADQAMLHFVGHTICGRALPPLARRGPVCRMDQRLPSLRAGQLRKRASSIFDHRVVCVVVFSARVGRPNELGQSFGDRAHLPIAHLMGGALIVDVHRRTDAMERRARPEVDPAQQVPAVHSVRAATQPKVRFRTAAAQRAHQDRQIERMDERVALLDRRSRRQPSVVRPRPVDKRQPVLTVGGPNQDRQCVSEIPEPIVADPIVVVPVANRKPLVQASLAVANRHEACGKDRIRIVPGTQSQADFERVRTARRRREFIQCLRKIERVNGELPAVPQRMLEIEAGKCRPSGIGVGANAVSVRDEHSTPGALRERAQRGGFELAHRTGSHDLELVSTHRRTATKRPSAYSRLRA